MLAIAFYTVLTTHAIALVGNAPIGMDYLAYDAALDRVWVPAGNTGNVDVIDVASSKVTAIAGFVTAPSTRAGRPNMGPSSASVGDGVVWVGNRGDNKVCAIDAKNLQKKFCVQLAAMPDGLAYVKKTHELWATTPREQSITIIGAENKTATIKLDGSPEGYAIDDSNARFYTNLEDKDKTVAIDIKTRKFVATFATGCGGDGPRGLAIDARLHFLLVACTDGAIVLDLAHKGATLGRIKTGGGVDNIDYDAKKQWLYIASGKEAMLHVVRVGADGKLAEVASAKTAAGARNAVIDQNGNAYVADSLQGRIIVIDAPVAK